VLVRLPVEAAPSVLEDEAAPAAAVA
jgi:hypothetical protein